MENTYLAARARADGAWGETYGRPPPISGLRKVFSESRRSLGDVLAGIDHIGRSYKALTQIVKATADSYPPDDDEPEEPIKH